MEGIETPDSPDGVVTGRVWLTLKGVEFPFEAWSDFPASVISSAVNAYSSIVSGDSEAFSYVFDGPYFLYYQYEATGDPLMYIEANCDRDENEVQSVVVGAVRLDEWRTALLHAVALIQAEIAGKPHMGELEKIFDRHFMLLNQPA
ncbi:MULTISPECIES: hypothetical protein [Actinoplanes]|uniref:hypothetical protein n=1 Tax=Actinoplanes TaxID=1865 RepID=UPI0012FB4750|nr:MULTISPECIES: hypothetical protein [Actinoplanes]